MLSIHFLGIWVVLHLERCSNLYSYCVCGLPYLGLSVYFFLCTWIVPHLRWVFFSFVVYLKILKEKEKKKKKKGRKKKRAIKKQRKGNLHCYDKLHKVYCCSPWMFHTQDDYGCFKLFSLVDRGVKR